jgi:hypothetical protein
VGKNITLDVPLYRQPKDSYQCTAACARMILAFDGRAETLQALAKELGIGKTVGAFLPRLGTLFLHRGYDVRIRGWEFWFPNGLFYLPPERTRQALLRWCGKQGSTKYGQQLREFLPKGGRYEFGPVTGADISAELIAGRPAILDLDSAILCAKRARTNRHSVVATALAGNDVVVNDPSTTYGGRRTYPLDRVLYCCHAIGGSIISVRPAR